ncbi:3-deoxy-manno-octulosonate cytidylyltransferase [Polynucleobacter sp. Adler-ghost]|uniref:3-deoxy-manno-octulosonate cytidylyltransferase n=1 Tax=Polynucleobacter sp. Adler-ghost TaxID=2770234 RepID=UPI001BFD620D|nr:3-deoxy-manno-octulosonate cytidylyltransferase [Polynucleobacter sp. Adler-ghost]QWE31057.1 3-deoxy-manno-octulosonate cytidylyltransferase [Polynucleobacter sp. Adler-ghost]
MKIIGVVPARMAASRFPGKPLKLIKGRPMIEHVFRRAELYQGWSNLVLATCDNEIQEYASRQSIPCVMTGSHHERALDRVAEAVQKMNLQVDDEDIVVCVQGDEPMMRPNMIDAVLEPLLVNTSIKATILAMHITDETIWLNPDTVKIVSNESGEILYTSRAPVPYCKGQFDAKHMARRIYGIFAFRWGNLNKFTAHKQTRLERLEACDSNRVLDMDFRQYIAPYPEIKSFSVDSLNDLSMVEASMEKDLLWGAY